ncbi:MAG: phosphate uptake regulator PhoU [Crenarchaeota archaeon]|nr:phosphate uptake regulator PhoU [Thermoproteota archaeon]
MPTNEEIESDEQRKLQVTGGSTFILSMPKEWVKRNQLKKGSALFLHEEDEGTLTIMPPKLVRQEKQEDAIIRVALNENPDSVTRKIVSAYLVGYSILHVKAQGQHQLPSKVRNTIKTFTRHLLVGTEIVTDTPADLTLQVLLNYSELSVQSAMRRMAIIAASMHKEAVASLRNQDVQTAKAVIETDDEVDRFNLYVIRLLKLAVSKPRIFKEIGIDGAKGGLAYRLITKAIERTADHATRIAENVILLNEKPDEALIEKIEQLSKLAIGMFEDSIESMFRKDYNLAESIIQKLDKIVELEKAAIISSKTFSIEQVSSLRLLIESVRRTAEYATDVSEVVLNMNIESVLG